MPIEEDACKIFNDEITCSNKDNKCTFPMHFNFSQQQVQERQEQVNVKEIQDELAKTSMVGFSRMCMLGEYKVH